MATVGWVGQTSAILPSPADPPFPPPQQPLAVRAGEEVAVAFWRCATPKKVWYEWAVTAPACSALHNPTGRSYTIGL